jgi:hypothetical protein
MGSLTDTSREALESMIADGRVVVGELLRTGRFNVDPWLAEVEPLLSDSLDLQDRRELNSAWATIVKQRAAHIVLDASFRILSLLETIESRYEIKA